MKKKTLSFKNNVNNFFVKLLTGQDLSASKNKDAENDKPTSTFRSTRAGNFWSNNSMGIAKLDKDNSLISPSKSNNSMNTSLTPLNMSDVSDWNKFSKRQANILQKLIGGGVKTSHKNKSRIDVSMDSAMWNDVFIYGLKYDSVKISNNIHVIHDYTTRVLVMDVKLNLGALVVGQMGNLQLQERLKKIEHISSSIQHFPSKKIIKTNPAKRQHYIHFKCENLNNLLVSVYCTMSYILGYSTLKRSQEDFPNLLEFMNKENSKSYAENISSRLSHYMREDNLFFEKKLGLMILDRKKFKFKKTVEENNVIVKKSPKKMKSKPETSNNLEEREEKKRTILFLKTLQK